MNFLKSKTAPDPVYTDYWIDILENPFKGSIKYYDGNKKQWVKIGNESGDIAELMTLISNKVDKVSDKGLSTNDYTTAEKQKLAGIAKNATKTTIENILTSTRTNTALSAAQGKALKDALNALTARVAALEAPAA